jgi:outer membrane biosynthesis protein TonB
MLAPRGDIETCIGAMKLRHIIPTDMTASALAHLSLLALVFLFSEVHPFGAVTAEPIAVDIVAPQDLPKQDLPKQELPKQEQPEIADFEKKSEPVPAPQFAPDKPAAASAPAPAVQPPARARPQQQAALAAPRAAPQQAPPPQAASPAPAYKPPEPDLTVKYNVLLGLPPDIMPAPPPSGEKSGDNFDAPATRAADVSSSVIAEFRRHLLTCSKLPASLKGSDDVKVRLRVLMTPQGKLAAKPMLIEASASAKGPLLLASAISALEACQPYAMLPVDRYGEWKVLDLSFTPQDFSQS